jgi:hypothetical protein
MAAYIIHFVHLAIVGHVGYIHRMAIVNNFIIDMSVQVSLSCPDLHSFGYMPGSGISGSYSSSVFSFWGTTILLSIVIALIYTSTNSGVNKGSFASASLSAFNFCVFDDSSSD